MVSMVVHSEQPDLAATATAASESGPVSRSGLGSGSVSAGAPAEADRVKLTERRPALMSQAGQRLRSLNSCLCESAHAQARARGRFTCRALLQFSRWPFASAHTQSLLPLSSTPGALSCPVAVSSTQKSRRWLRNDDVAALRPPWIDGKLSCARRRVNTVQCAATVFPDATYRSEASRRIERALYE